MAGRSGNLLTRWMRRPLAVAGLRFGLDVGITDMPGRQFDGEPLSGERDLHRNALHDLGEVAGGIVRRQQRKFLPLAGAMLVDATVHDWPGNMVDGNIDGLTGTNIPVSCVSFEIRHHIGAGDRHHRHQLRAGLHETGRRGSVRLPITPSIGAMTRCSRD